MKKYELTSETMEIGTITLRRIKALAAFADVNAGELGGWIEKESNLDQAGDAWVYGDALVYGNARVYGNALVYGDALVYGNALVSGDALVYGNAWVYGDALVSGDALVYGNALVSGDARVCGNARVYGDARVSGDARVYGDARVCGNKHYIVIAPIGSRDGSITFTRDKKGGIFASVGCFYGPLLKFREKVRTTHGNTAHAQAYLLAAQLAETRIDTTPIDDDTEDGDR